MSNQSLEINCKNRFFLPMVPPYLKPPVLQHIMKNTSWIGFNRFELRHSRFYYDLKRKGLRNYFGIPDCIKIFLSSIAKDEELIRFFSDPNWLENFKGDIKDFDVDVAMGPDWFSYKDDLLSQRRRNVEKAIDLNIALLELENVVPTITGTSIEEFTTFVKPFKSQGKTLFVLPGREYLVNLGDRKRAQLEFSSLTSALTKSEKVELIITGCNSPKLMEMLTTALGFSGLGWLIQARQRRLIMGKVYLSIFDPVFFCNDLSCCGAIRKEDLRNPENDSIRAVHNLRRINATLGNTSRLSQAYLEVFCGKIP